MNEGGAADAAVNYFFCASAAGAATQRVSTSDVESRMKRLQGGATIADRRAARTLALRRCALDAVSPAGRVDTGTLMST